MHIGIASLVVVYLRWSARHAPVGLYGGLCIEFRRGQLRRRDTIRVLGRHGITDLT
jgi:hypothetical protein